MAINLNHSIDYHYNKFPPERLDYGKLISPIASAISALSRYDQMLKNMHNSEILLAPLMNREAVLTSRMEGTISTLDEILQYEAEDHHEGSANVRDDIIETILYKRALVGTQKAMESGRQISPFLVRSTHAVMLSFGRGVNKSPGKFKTEQNYITDKTRKNVLFTPISPEHLPKALDDLFDYLQTADENPLIKIAVFHVEFEALHPFKDGNGRIGRMLITLMLWSLGLISHPHFYMSQYLEENKNLYIDLMREVSEKDKWTNWCAFFFNAVENQAIKNLTIAEEILGLYKDMKAPFENLLSSKWSVRVLDYLFTNPIFRINKMANEIAVKQHSTSRFVKTLQNDNLVRLIVPAAGRRAAIYSFEPLLELVRV